MILTRSAIVGSARNNEITRPVKWYSPAKAVELELLPGTFENFPTDINNSGLAVGEADGRAVLWSENGKVEALPVPEGTRYSNAFAINERGEVVGYSQGGGKHRPVRWTP